MTTNTMSRTKAAAADAGVWRTLLSAVVGMTLGIATAGAFNALVGS